MQRLSAQRHRVNRVVNFAQTNLAERLDLDRLADVACLSKYHFVRVFGSHYCEPPVQFLWRLRLERAARSLVIHPEKSITDIALDCGFSGSQTFSRAFRKHFHVAPRALRPAERTGFAGLSEVQPANPATAASLSAPLTNRWEQSPMRIEARPEVRVAYVRHIGPYWNVDGGIGRAFVALEQWAQSQGLWSGASYVIGFCPDNAAVTPAGYCIYDACLPVSADVPEDDVVSIRTIPAGLYGVMTVLCTSAEMESAWNWLTLEWLKETGLSCALVHSYEVFPLVDGKLAGPIAGAELCLRLKADEAENCNPG